MFSCSRNAQVTVQRYNSWKWIVEEKIAAIDIYFMQSDKAFKGIAGNRPLLSLHGGSLEIMHTEPDFKEFEPRLKFAQIWLVPLKNVLKFSRFKTALNWNQVLADLSRGSNSLNWDTDTDICWCFSKSLCECNVSGSNIFFRKWRFCNPFSSDLSGKLGWTWSWVVK